jgi:alpha-glucuronidase
MRLVRLLLLAFILPLYVCADDGYRLWLAYRPIEDTNLASRYRAALTTVAVNSSSPTLAAARDELLVGLKSLLGIPVELAEAKSASLVVGTTRSEPLISSFNLTAELDSVGVEGFVIRHLESAGQRRIVVAANSDVGVLYGSFALLRLLQQGVPLESLNVKEAPKIQRRLLNHWDNLNRFVERGQAGFSLWEWFSLPDYVSPRYRDYARANASVGINGTVLTNVNADATVLMDEYIAKVAALANVFRPYGIKVYLTARFSAPREIGGLDTADPLDPRVSAWWKDRVARIYRAVPDFGGFLVKANSEGQPGPQDYKRSHADGANMLADALAPHGGIVMWRAFVYDHNVPADRAKQAFTEFQPQDGKFRDNVVIQIKNGPIDFMPREPFHPLFGAMPATNLGLELQITQEYLGGAVHLAYLAPMFEETLDADTFTRGPGSTVAKVIDGTLSQRKLSVIAGVANIGNDRNWTGHPLAQANWYAFGRLSWDHQLPSSDILDEWTRQTHKRSEHVVKTLHEMMMESRETVVNYSMPLGLHHIMAEGHHYGPGPWFDKGRPDWTSVYYHRADKHGIGFDRTSTGSNALEQYAPEIQKRWGNPAQCPDNLLLWFHHLPWDFQMKSGRTLWDELCLTYQRGVNTVQAWTPRWAQLRTEIDEQTFDHVRALLNRQAREAREWKDACLLYFQTFSGRPFPKGVEPPEHPLEHYKSIERVWVPGDPSGR